jgi:hypothetical protein
VTVAERLNPPRSPFDGAGEVSLKSTEAEAKVSCSGSWKETFWDWTCGAAIPKRGTVQEGLMARG